MSEPDESRVQALMAEVERLRMQASRRETEIRGLRETNGFLRRQVYDSHDIIEKLRGGEDA